MYQRLNTVFKINKIILYYVILTNIAPFSAGWADWNSTFMHKWLIRICQVDGRQYKNGELVCKKGHLGVHNIYIYIYIYIILFKNSFFNFVIEIRKSDIIEKGLPTACATLPRSYDRARHWSPPLLLVHHLKVFGDWIPFSDGTCLQLCSYTLIGVNNITSLHRCC